MGGGRWGMLYMDSTAGRGTQHELSSGHQNTSASRCFQSWTMAPETVGARRGDDWGTAGPDKAGLYRWLGIAAGLAMDLMKY